MHLRLIVKDFLTYGALDLRGKVTAAFLFVASPVCAEPVTVLALGDSLTQGYGLVQEDGLVPQLQAWLRNEGAEATVINGGVSGDTTAGGAARVAWSLTPEVDAMIVTLGGNDLLRGLDPAVSQGNLTAILQTAVDMGVEVLLVGVPAPGNYGPEYKAQFDAIYPTLAERFGTLYVENFFQGLEAADPAAAQKFFQSDGIHPNAVGVQRIVRALGPEVIRLIEEVN